MKLNNGIHDTIVALATPPGSGAIAVIRISGSKSFEIVNELFKGKDLTDQATHTIHLGTLALNDQIIDEVLVSLFKGPRSYTKEDVIEISCHGSLFVIQEIIRSLLEKGTRLAKPGEFTKRAFLNGRFDLAQAEAVADLIASENKTSHQAAINQMRGGFSREIKELREELIHFASMIELELDFSEEDVEFASRDKLNELVSKLKTAIETLIESFTLGNVIKNGVPTVIAGKPNAGKSTLLNALLNEERAIVSEIPGTTRDAIEDQIVIEGVHFRFIDTAGIRETSDKVEAMGVERTHAKMKEASVVLYIVDTANETIVELNKQINKLENQGIPYLIIGNKMDKGKEEIIQQLSKDHRAVLISASHRDNLETLKTRLLETVNLDSFSIGNTIVTNTRHFESLRETNQALQDVLKGIDNQVTNDFLAMDIRHALQALGEITGEITNDDLLANIFSKFCIGK